jgi:hypothetical protein
LGEADFHKIKSGDTLSTSHGGLNTAEDNSGLTESFLYLLNCVMPVWEFIFFVIKIYLDFN